MSTPSSALAPISLEEARRQRDRMAAFVDKWVRRTAGRYDATAAQLEDLRSAGITGALRGQREWEALPEHERDEHGRRVLVARRIETEVRAAWHRMGGRPKGKRAAALEAATHPRIDYEGVSLRERLRDIRAHLNHGVYAGLLHGSLGMDSPEDVYLDREQQSLDRDRLEFALARLEDENDRVLAHQLLIEGRSLTEACAAIGIHDKSKRTRARERLFERMRAHAAAFASSLAQKLPPDRGGGGRPPA